VTGGRSFSDGATENETTKILKREAVTAKGDAENHEMMTAEKYSKAFYGSRLKLCRMNVTLNPCGWRA
jgi:hypothetical protein